MFAWEYKGSYLTLRECLDVRWYSLSETKGMKSLDAVVGRVVRSTIVTTLVYQWAVEFPFKIRMLRPISNLAMCWCPGEDFR